MFSLAEVIEKLNRDFICLRASRKSDGRAEGDVATLGFDWEDAASDELIAELNAKHAHLLRGTCNAIAVRGEVRKVTDDEVPGIAAWSKGRLRTNYQFYLLTPEGKAIDLEFNERDPQGAQYWQVGWTSRFVMPRLLGPRGRENRIEWHVGRADRDVILTTLGKVAKTYPAKEHRLAVPWQKDASFAVRWAKRDQKRILVVPAPGGRVDPALEDLLSSQDVLRRFHRSFSYLKLDPAKAGELSSTLRDGGVVVCDVPGPDCAVEWSGERHSLTNVVEAATEPHTKKSLTKLLQKHAVAADAPTWTRLSRARRGK